MARWAGRSRTSSAPPSRNKSGCGRFSSWSTLCRRDAAPPSPQTARSSSTGRPWSSPTSPHRSRPMSSPSPRFRSHLRCAWAWSGLRFSRDGKYILAQDETSISVLSREPYSKLFRFDAEDALPAEFSPDSQRIVFQTPGLHTEEWSVADQKLLTAHEPITREPCFESRISPDGRTLFCLTLRREDLTLTLDLTVLDTATGNTLFQKKGFMDLSVETFIILDIFHRLSSFEYLLPGSVSADGNVFLLGAGANKMAFDLRTQAPVPVGKDIKSSINGPYAFLGNDKVVGDMFNGRSIAGPIIWDTAIFSFPDGKKLQNFPFRVNNFESVTSENYCPHPPLWRVPRGARRCLRRQVHRCIQSSLHGRVEWAAAQRKSRWQRGAAQDRRQTRRRPGSDPSNQPAEPVNIRRTLGRSSISCLHHAHARRCLGPDHRPASPAGPPLHRSRLRAGQLALCGVSQVRERRARHRPLHLCAFFRHARLLQDRRHHASHPGHVSGVEAGRQGQKGG